MFKTFLPGTIEAIQYIVASVSFEPEAVQLQMEAIKQEIQTATSD